MEPPTVRGKLRLESTLMRFGAFVSAATAFCAWVASCSGNKSIPADAGDDGGTADADLVGCTSDPRDDTYTANLQKPGKSRVFQFVLLSSDPSPPAKGTDTWTLEVLDSGGNRVTDATFAQPGSITPWMPDHGHGSSAIPQATANPDGTYTITPLYFFMAGLWQVTITAQSGSMKDTVVYSFCIAG